MRACPLDIIFHWALKVIKGNGQNYSRLLVFCRTVNDHVCVILMK
jgi:hypothetical protein